MAVFSFHPTFLSAKHSPGRLPGCLRWRSNAYAGLFIVHGPGDPGASSLPTNSSFAYRFVRLQNTKLTGVCFKVQVIPYVSVQVDINYVIASAINLLAFGPCLPQQV